MTAPKKNYRVKEFRPGLFRVMDGSTPIYDQSQDGDDKPLVFRDADFADECARELVRNEGATEKQAREAAKLASEALYNVPEVGRKYDQQHSDTHMKAVLALAEAILPFAEKSKPISPA